MVNSKPYVIGIDMGGTNTVFGIVDARGVVLTSDSIKTKKHSNINDYIDELYTETMRLVRAIDAEGKIFGIGVGAPNANYFTGMIEDGVNLPWLPGAFRAVAFGEVRYPRGDHQRRQRGCYR